MSDAECTIVSPAVIVPNADIDTDQIIPSRFLVTASYVGLGRHLFADRRDPWAAHLPDAPAIGSPNGARILVAGQNFGCGSFREHAVWALLDAGFRAIVSSRFADQFRSNAGSNGLLPVEIEETKLTTLCRFLKHNPKSIVSTLTNYKLINYVKTPI